MATIKRFEDLEIWQIARQLNKEIIELARTTDLKRDFGLKDQIMRTSESVMNNIAEGFGRFSRVEFLRYLRISLGSLNELRTQLIIAKKRNYLNESKYNDLIYAII